MRKLMVLGAVVAAVAGITFLAGSLGGGDGVSANGQGAIAGRAECGIFTDVYGGGWADDFDAHYVVNNNGGLLNCKAAIGDPLPDRTVMFNFDNTGIVCGTPAGDTEDWAMTITPSGQVILECHFHN